MFVMCVAYMPCQCVLGTRFDRVTESFSRKAVSKGCVVCEWYACDSWFVICKNCPRTSQNFHPPVWVEFTPLGVGEWGMSHSKSC